MTHFDITKFRNGNAVISDLSKYIHDYLIANPDRRMFIGSDSNPRTNKFAVVIAFHTGYENGHGVHYIYNTFRMKRTDRFNRLFNESKFILEVAEFVETELHDFKSSYANNLPSPYRKALYENENVPKLPNGKFSTLHADVSSDEAHGSFIAYNAIIGYLTGHGYAVSAKPDSWSASCAADAICKR